MAAGGGGQVPEALFGGAGLPLGGAKDEAGGRGRTV